LDAEDAALVALAHWLGERALPGFGLGLVTVSATAALLWWLLQQRHARGALGALPTPAYQLLRMAFGFALIVGAAALFAELADGLQAREAMGAIDEAFTAGLAASVPQAALVFFAAVTRAADTATLTVLGIGVAGLLLARGRRGLALAWATAVGGNALLNVTLKGVFERARPLHDDGLVMAQGWSFPSGHASGAVVAFGMLAYLLVRGLPPRWHLPVVVLASALAFTVGCSRVFLRVHHASDVVAGFASGGAWLAVCIASVEATRWYRRSRRRSKG
jgi:undecaprenyl-diphosphatase